jgi:hypothetical protein
MCGLVRLAGEYTGAAAVESYRSTELSLARMHAACGRRERRPVRGWRPFAARRVALALKGILNKRLAYSALTGSELP